MSESGQGGPRIDVPEDFDLEARLAAPSSTPDADLPRCPACGSKQVTSKVKKAMGDPHREDGGDWRCRGCGHHFDRPYRGGGGA